MRGFNDERKEGLNIIKGADMGMEEEGEGFLVE